MRKAFKAVFAAIIAASMLPVSAVVNSAQSATVIKLNPAAASPFNNGEFEGWGTSMGWWGNRIGHSDKMAEQAAKLFYSDEGLGLDIVRYNVGGGDDPSHNHVTRSDSKIPCFAVPSLDGDGKPVTDEDGKYVYTYDWDADADQMNVLQKIKEQNSDVHIEGYTNSPPWFMTKTGCSGGGKVTTNSEGKVTAIDENLDPANYAQFAEFLGGVTEHFNDIGLHFDSYSPMNEPEPKSKYWGELSPKQEGNHVAAGANQSGLIDALSAEYDKRGIDTLVVGLDETNIDYSISSFGALTETARANLDRLDTHTYGGSKRAELKQTAVDGGKNLWMSEVDGSWDEYGLADRIIADLNGMQASAWVLWDIVDSHKDANFTAPDGSKPEANNSVDPDAKMWGMAMGNHDTEEIELTQKYYGYGQFTRYIEPGMTIIASSNSTLAAYDKKTGKIAVVAVNPGEAKTVKFDLRSFSKTGAQAKPVRTSGSYVSGEHWAELDPIAVNDKQFTAELKADSITTYVIEGDGTPVDYVTIGGPDSVSVGIDYTFTAGGSLDFTEGSVKWSVSDPEAADITVDAATNKATVKAKKGGIFTLTATAGNTSTSTDITAIDGSEKYKGTQYEFIRNIAAATNDFNDGNLNGFVLTGDAKLGTDGDGETVLLPQSVLNNKDKVSNAGTAILTPETPLSCTEEQIINLSFDMFTPNSDGNSDFALLSSDGTNIASIRANSWGNKYTVTIGDKEVETAGDGATYFKNNVSDRQNPSYIKNGGHVEVYYSPSDGDVTVTINNVSNNAALKTYKGTTKANNIGKVSFAGTYTAWNKTMVVDNLVTNIIESTANNLKITGTDGKKADVSYRLAEDIDKAVLIGALYNTDGVLEEVKVKKIENASKGGKTADSIEFDRNVSDYDAKVMLWKSINGEGAMTPLCSSGVAPAKILPTSEPVLPKSGELISLNFDNGDLTSGSTYGKASGTAKFAEVDGKKCVQFDNTNATVLTLTDANGNPLLTGKKNITVSFKVKPTITGTSWWFYAAPNDSAPVYQQEKYIGALTKSNTIEVERYNNSGARSAAASTALQSNQWNDVMISVSDDVTDVYVNGVKASADSTVNIADMLGSNSVCYIGKANWGSGEYATGYIDDFVIYNHAIENPLGSIDLGDLSAVTADITIPSADGITWETSDAAVVTADGKVIRADDTKKAVLTAKTVKDGITFTKSFNVTVKGYTAALDSFKVYAEGNKVVYSSDYNAETEKYLLNVVLLPLDENGQGGGQTALPSGEFENLTVGKYEFSAALYDGDEQTAKRKIVKTINIKDTDDMEAYLFVHFVDTQETAEKEQIYFSVSEDGQTWTTLNDKKPVLTSNVGEKGVRDPYILRGEDGKFFIIATDLSIYNTKNNGKDDWGRAAQRGSKSIVVWESSDLVNWSAASLVKVNNDNAGCTWAPEAVYDPEKDEYMVFWASVISDDSYTKFRIYRSYTSDFKTFSEPELYIEEPNAVIDTTIIDHKGVYYRFTKNEARSSITMQECTSLNGNWKDMERYNLGDMTGYEGPTIYKLNGEDKWCLLLDYFSKSQGYKPFVTSNITKGIFTEGTAFNFDGTYRHGTVMPITRAEYDALTSKQW